MATKKEYAKKKRNLPIGLIAGGVIGGVALVAIILVFAFSSASKNSASQEAPKHMAAVTNQPTPGRSGPGIAAKNRQLSTREAGIRVSSVTGAKTAVENGPRLSRAVAWMTFSPSGDHFFAVPAGQNKGLLWAVPSWQETKASSSQCNYFSVPAVFSHDGRFLACQDGEMLRIWNITASPAALVNNIPTYRPNADDPSWNGIFWANDGTLVTRNPEGGFQFLSQDKAKGAILAATVGCGKDGLLQLGNRRFVGNNLTPGTLQIKDVAVATSGKAFGALNGKRDKKPGFFIWLIPSAEPAGFLSFDLAGEPDTWECNGITLSQDGSELAASLYYPGTIRPPLPKTWIASIWHSGSPPKKLDLPGNENNLVDFRFRAFSPNGWWAATSGATSLPTADGNVIKRFVAIWDTASGKKLWQVDDVFTKEVFFTKDGRTLVTGAADTSTRADSTAGGGMFFDKLDPKVPQTVDFWDVETRQRRCQFKDTGIQSLAVSPDGTTLVTAYPQLEGAGTVSGFAGEKGMALTVHRFPVNREQLSDEMLEKEARERRREFLNGMSGPGGDGSGGTTVLEYLKSINGKYTVAGMHNREPNSRPVMQTQRVYSLVERYPGLWSGDFLFQADDVRNRWTMIRECKKQWEEGAIVQLMLHVAPPNQPEACAWRGGVLSHLGDDQWKDLVTDGGKLNKAWKSRLDGYAVYLQFLKDSGVQVLFRPFHEMNQGNFWWGGRKGPLGTARLYRLTRDYLVGAKGLANLVWVWDMQDMSRDFAEYNPGGEYWDIFAFDVYGDGYKKSWYDYILPIIGDKPMAIGECSKLPTAQMLATQPRWCFFMSWAELTFKDNTNRQIIDLYRSERVVTRERLPKFRSVDKAK